MTNKKLNGVSQVMENEEIVKQLNATKNGTMELSEKNLEEIAGGKPSSSGCNPYSQNPPQRNSDEWKKILRF